MGNVGYRWNGACVRCLYAIALGLSLVFGGAFASGSPTFVSVAMADDDDGDDGDDGGPGGGGSPGGGGGGGRGDSEGGVDRSRGGGDVWNIFRPRRNAAPRRARPERRVRRPARTRQRPAARPAPPPPQQEPNEIVALGLSEDELASLVAGGYTLLQEDTVVRLDANVARLAIPPQTSLEDAREDVRALNATAVADFNHFYRPETSPAAAEPCEALSCGSAKLIAWPAAPGSRGTCAAGASIGLVDTGINAEHGALQGKDLRVLPFDLARPQMRGSGSQHGTAVAAIILSGAESRAPGLIPDATVFAVDAFFRAPGRGQALDERTDAYTLVRALDEVAANPITVLNLSLAGPANTPLAAMVESLNEDGIVIVASTGNDGARAKPVYPAAYPGVIAVTAVDRNGTVFRRAGRGAHVDFAAPGVEVWTAASIRGVRPKTGTSFAAPFVTAAVALTQAGGGAAGHDAVVDALAISARDLGAEGRDDVYGHGLVQASGACPPGPAGTIQSAGPDP